jgi:hypothetical protein
MFTSVLPFFAKWKVARLTALLLQSAADGDVDETSSSMVIARASPDLVDSDTESGPVKEEEGLSCKPKLPAEFEAKPGSSSSSISSSIGASSIDEVAETPAEKQANSSGGISNAGHLHPHSHHLQIPLDADEVLLFEHQLLLLQQQPPPHHAFVLQQLVHGSSSAIEDLFPHWEDQAHAIWGT